jgi:hypothetical protein
VRRQKIGPSCIVLKPPLPLPCTIHAPVGSTRRPPGVIASLMIGGPLMESWTLRPYGLDKGRWWPPGRWAVRWLLTLQFLAGSPTIEACCFSFIGSPCADIGPRMPRQPNFWVIYATTMWNVEHADCSTIRTKQNNFRACSDGFFVAPDLRC